MAGASSLHHRMAVETDADDGRAVSLAVDARHHLGAIDLTTTTCDFLDEYHSHWVRVTVDEAEQYAQGILEMVRAIRDQQQPQ